MVVIVDHRIVGTQFIASANDVFNSEDIENVGTQFIASANDVSDAMNRVPTIQRMHSSNKSLLPSPDVACVGIADGWGERASAAALTVGLIFCTLFYPEKSVRKMSCLWHCRHYGGILRYTQDEHRLYTGR